MNCHSTIEFPVRISVYIVCTLLAASAVAVPSTLAGELKTSSGGTGGSRSGGNGGTGVSTTANAPAAALRSTFQPLHVTLPPQAGVRPHTDLAAAVKRNMLSTKRLIKPSSLNNKVHAPVRDPLLMAAVLKKIAYPDGGGSSFKTLHTLKAAESNGKIYPANGVSSGKHEEAGTLSSGAPTEMQASDDDAPVDESAEGGWLLKWLMNIAAVAGSGALAWVLWRQLPPGARMTLPVAATS